MCKQCDHMQKRCGDREVFCRYCAPGLLLAAAIPSAAALLAMPMDPCDLIPMLTCSTNDAAMPAVLSGVRRRAILRYWVCSRRYSGRWMRRSRTMGAFTPGMEIESPIWHDAPPSLASPLCASTTALTMSLVMRSSSKR